MDIIDYRTRMIIYDPVDHASLDSVRVRVRASSPAADLMVSLQIARLHY
jgi:hypothetical protein